MLEWNFWGSNLFLLSASPSKGKNWSELVEMVGFRFFQGRRLQGNSRLTAVFCLGFHHCPSSRLSLSQALPGSWLLTFSIVGLDTSRLSRLFQWVLDNSITMTFLILEELMGCSIVEWTIGPAESNVGPIAQGSCSDRPCLLFLLILLTSLNALGIGTSWCVAPTF